MHEAFQKEHTAFRISSPLRDTMCIIYYNSADIFEKFSSVRILQNASCSRHISGEVKIPWNISLRRSWEQYITHDTIDAILFAYLVQFRVPCVTIYAAVLICIFRTAQPTEWVTPKSNQDVPYLIYLQNLEWRYNDDFFAFISNSGIIKGIVFPAPVPAMTTESRPNRIISMTSNCPS